MTDVPGLDRLSPVAERVAAAGVDEIASLGIVAARAGCILGVARAVASGKLRLEPGGDPAGTVAQLLELPGIGPWTAQYIVMRALGWPDAFPSGDVAVLNSLGGLSARQADELSQAWRPWRSYAVLHLWNRSTTIDRDASLRSHGDRLAGRTAQARRRRRRPGGDPLGERRPRPLRPRCGAAQPTTRCWPAPPGSSRSTSRGRARRSTCRSPSPRGTPFQQKVWRALLTIPFGETRSYGEIAAQIGSPRAVRAVGAANGRNPLSIVAPCHRVVGANGKLTGFAGGLETKAYLLALEGGGAS